MYNNIFKIILSCNHIIISIFKLHLKFHLRNLHQRVNYHLVARAHGDSLVLV